MGKIIQFNKKSQMRDPLSMTNDIIFFLVYGAGTKESNKALLSLLNVVLERKDPITEVKICLLYTSRRHGYRQNHTDSGRKPRHDVSGSSHRAVSYTHLDVYKRQV